MPVFLKYAIIVVISYLLGSISSAVIISKLRFHEDVRTSGSGNAGATNMARVYGWGAGLTVYALDMGKALIACGIGWYFLGGFGMCAAGIACNVGHCFPVFFHFAGGKGVSVACLLMFLVDWRVFVITMVIFVLEVLITKKVSLGSITCCVLQLALSLMFHLETYDVILSASIAVVILLRHIPNIKRLLRGEESNFSPKKREPKNKDK